MKIKNDKTKIEAAIAAVEGKATARTCNYANFTDLVKFAEDELKGLGLAKTHWKGVTATFRHGAVCNSYKYPAVGTELEITYFPSGWFLTGVSRGHVGSGRYGGNDKYKMRLPNDTQRIFVAHCEYLEDMQPYINSGFELADKIQKSALVVGEAFSISHKIRCELEAVDIYQRAMDGKVEYVALNEPTYLKGLELVQGAAVVKALEEVATAAPETNEIGMF